MLRLFHALVLLTQAAGWFYIIIHHAFRTRGNVWPHYPAKYKKIKNKNVFVEITLNHTKQSV